MYKLIVDKQILYLLIIRYFKLDNTVLESFYKQFYVFCVYFGVQNNFVEHDLIWSKIEDYRAQKEGKMQIIALQRQFSNATALLGMNRTWQGIKCLSTIRVTPLRHQPRPSQLGRVTSTIVLVISAFALRVIVLVLLISSCIHY